MTNVDELYQQIIMLSNTVEGLIADANEAQCAELLAQRQSVLEELSHQVSLLTQEHKNPEILEQYQNFIKQLIVRDNDAVATIIDAKKSLTGQLSVQVKTKKALTAYQKFNI